MLSTLSAGHAVALGAEHAHANSGVGMPPGLRSVPQTDAVPSCDKPKRTKAGMGSVGRKGLREQPVLHGLRAQEALHRQPVEDGNVRAAATMVYYRETEGLPPL
ncbi:MAG: hypothetical protein IMZ44_06105 [Planctomycetes bacterium]|nr:hypothetical protein [Planctomycetota bacterium]